MLHHTDTPLRPLPKLCAHRSELIDRTIQPGSGFAELLGLLIDLLTQLPGRSQHKHARALVICRSCKLVSLDLDVAREEVTQGLATASLRNAYTLSSFGNNLDSKTVKLHAPCRRQPA